MASSDKKKQYRAEDPKTDRRTCAGRAKAEAQMKTTDVLVRMLRKVKCFGIPADYVLFDSWFSFPSVIMKIRKIGYHVVGRLKNTPKVHYEFQSKPQTLKQIYDASKKRRGKSRYLLSVEIRIRDDTGKSTESRIVYVRNRNKRKEWIAFICTDMTLSEDEIVALYGKRWSIEVFFKTCKTYLRFTGEFRQTSYEAVTAHTAIVALRYMILAVNRRRETDPRTMGELFYSVYDEAKDITFREAVALIIGLLTDIVTSTEIGLADSQIRAIMNSFIDALPGCFKRLLTQDFVQNRCPA
jgi:hypothetical protein